MAGIMSGAVSRLKHDVQQFLSVTFVAHLAWELGLAWRNTPLAVPHLVALFARQILGGNVSMPELARLAGSRFTPEAYCTARGRLPMQLLKELLRRVCTLGSRKVQGCALLLWKGHRLWHMDGTSFSMPDTPELQERFGQSGQQKKGCGFPTAHLLCLFDAATGLIHDCIVSPLRTHDMAHAPQLHPAMRRGDLLIVDRAFESFVHLALLLGQGLHVLVPVHQKRQVDFRRRQCRRGKKGRRIERQTLRRCGPCDQIVRWLKPAQRPKWMSREQYEALPQTIEVRQIKRTVTLATGRKQKIVLVTTLLDDTQYPAQELVELLKGRWQVEVNLRHLKTTMKMDILRSQTAAGIEKELWMFLIVYNLVRLIVLEASQRQSTAVSRISFADALYWIRHGDLNLEIPELLLVPLRPDRVEPRVIKRRTMEYPLMTKPREVLRKALMGRRR
jgi:Transposase DDE domain